MSLSTAAVLHCVAALQIGGRLSGGKGGAGSGEAGHGGTDEREMHHSGKGMDCCFEFSDAEVDAMPLDGRANERECSSCRTFV